MSDWHIVSSVKIHLSIVIMMILSVFEASPGYSKQSGKLLRHIYLGS